MSDAAFDTGFVDIKPKEFAQIKAFAQDTFGLDLRQGRERLVSARLGKHLRAGGYRSFEEYFRAVQSDKTGESMITLIDALTTNHTSFLREREHFDFITNLVGTEWSNRSSLHLWSAACSSGEEPYSILFTLLEAAATRRVDVQITATDISSKVLSIAQAGIYGQERVATVPAPWLTRYFSKTPGKEMAMYQVRPEYRNRIRFQRFNLMHRIQSRQMYPAIFCRNVMIYFNKTTQSELVNRLAACIEPGGYLLVGHAESLTGIDHPLQYVRPAVYRKPR